MKTVVGTIVSMMITGLFYLSSCQSNVSIETAQYAVNGQKLYRTHCLNCHGVKGEGLGRLYPPLTDNDYFVKNKEKLSCIVKHGINGEIVVNGIKFNQQMPANPQLTDMDIAYILTYITTTFGQSDTTYTQQTVKRDLANCQ